MAEVTNDEANDLAEEILRGEQFVGEAEPGPVQRAIDRVIEEIVELLGRIFGGLGSAAGGGLGAVLAYGLLAVAVGVLLFAIYRAFAGRTPKSTSEGFGSARVVFDDVVEPAELEQLLGRYRSQSDWRNAVIAGFRLAVVQVLDQGIAREQAGATTGYFARAIEERQPNLLAPYTPAAESFERAFYSDLAIGPSDLDQIDALLRQLSLVGAS